MALVNKTALDVANTSIITAINNVFDGGPEGVYKEFTTVVPAEGTSIDIVVVDGLPQVREWLGSKQYYGLRASKKNVVRRKWEATLELERVDLDGDKSGVVGQRIAAFADRVSRAYDYITLQALIDNTITGYDGVSLLNDSHPNVNNTTYDNLTTSALDHDTFKSGMTAIEQTKDLNGEPLGLYGTTLLVGSALRRKGMEVTGSTRPVAMSNAGALDATSNVVAAASYENYLGGSVNLLVTPRITGNQWFLFDLSKPFKPMIMGEFRKPEIIAQTAMDAPARFENDVYRWSLELDVSPVPGAWQTSYGSVT